MSQFPNPVLQSIFEEMCRVAGNHPDGSHLAGLPYGSYHHPKFTYLSNSVTRDTLTRLKEFQIPERLDQIVFFDLGCNLGHIAIELARRGAIVKAFDCMTPRVEVLKRLVQYLDYEKQIEVYEADLTQVDPAEFREKYGMADFTICLAVDGYIPDYEKFYQFLSQITNECCYLESNRPQSVVQPLQKVFKKVTPLGHSQTSNALRQLYLLDNMELLVEKGGNYPKKHYLNRSGTYIKSYSFDFEKTQSLIGRLHSPYIIPMKVQSNRILMPYLQNGLPLGWTAQLPEDPNFRKHYIPLKNHPEWSMLSLSLTDKNMIKKQLIQVIRHLHQIGIAHRDLIISNVLWLPEIKIIQIIDWEFIVDESHSSEFLDLKMHTGNADRTQIFHHNSLFSAFFPELTFYEYLGELRSPLSLPSSSFGWGNDISHDPIFPLIASL